jgi:hypothetical protein
MGRAIEVDPRLPLSGPFGLLKKDPASAVSPSKGLTRSFCDLFQTPSKGDELQQLSQGCRCPRVCVRSILEAHTHCIQEQGL